MKAATLSELKQELQTRPAKEILKLCLRLARFKKENKELLTFLLFEADDINSYVSNIKNEMTEMFAEVNTSNFYYEKKGLRKILRHTNKFIRYSANKEAEIELLLHYCTLLKSCGIKIKSTGLSNLFNVQTKKIKKSTALINLFDAQIKKIKKAIEGLHEDLQFEYKRELEKLED